MERQIKSITDANQIQRQFFSPNFQPIEQLVSTYGIFAQIYRHAELSDYYLSLFYQKRRNGNVRKYVRLPIDAPDDNYAHFKKLVEVALIETVDVYERFVIKPQVKKAWRRFFKRSEGIKG